jgi:GTP cyclohydrolase II
MTEDPRISSQETAAATAAELLTAPRPDGPAHLPLRWEGGETPFVLWHFDFGGDRWVAAATGDLTDGEPVPLRIESACVFGHVLRSAQCDCGYQLEEAMKSFARNGRGLLVYGVDQDARGLGIAAHFAIYAMRQQENLDTDAVYARLDAPVDARSYEPVGAVLRHLGVSNVLLLSNNPRRDAFLRREGFTVRTQPLEAPLDVHNMSTLMLEKEDLGYRWSFETHADWLEPLQRSVAGRPGRSAAWAVVPGSGASGTPLAAADDDGTGELATRLSAALPATVAAGTLVVYLTDLPRADELACYARLGATVVVVPFADLPPALREAAREYGVKLVDWERRNAYQEERPQWRLTHRTDTADVYLRDGVARFVTPHATPVDRPEEDAAAQAASLLRTLREQAGLDGVRLLTGGDTTVRWVEYDTTAAGISVEDVLARMAAGTVVGTPT